MQFERLGVDSSDDPAAMAQVVALQSGASTPESCQVLGDGFGVFVQFALATIVMSTLFTKWYFEDPRRQLKTFALDSSKQVVGAGAIHIMNMGCAVLFAKHMEHPADECSWYWVNIMIDTTVGVLFCYAFLKLTEYFLGYDTGHYGKTGGTGIDWEHDPDYWKWAGQIVVWCFIVSTMKLFVVLAMMAAADFWVKLSMACTHWIANQRLRLIFVMIVTPTVMNIFQFCVQDSFLKYQMLKKSKAKDDKGEV
mmetsp:Transcript_56216/g.119675  ORF Transcript_56216/g.119675 Transcript_56216/m.119675 type:complete len:251 (-) Transcript_56216:29-781(-)|eukprot:CAMPEP_0206426026 /NCGR_PEP_ID=MMETSP0324_2-20121206/4136_1 /ASSEMBLY_ACC=CAM_ASM_000836 /TAXON_ID=2866 /ORGANISM="Crypthecodinium cohnii, Strain Seligo" /LENGTH=250 /DNA_ID=CAMNT_0053890909 /DNA_START=180 /DNA_END=932 /DNA_ORIENTATION=-